MSNKYWSEAKVKLDNGQEDVVRFYVVKPSNAVDKEANRYRAKVWQQCIADGILTREEVKKVLVERKIWDATKDAEEKALKDKLNELQKKLYLGNGDTKRMKLSEGKDLAIQMRITRNELRTLIGQKIAMEENTAEALSDNARFDYVVASCTFDEADNRVYKDIEDYNSKSADEVAFAAASKLGEVIFGLDGKFEQNLPENKWLKKFNLVDADLSLVNKQGQLVDKEGRAIDADGYYVDANKKRTDVDGNPLAEDGGYELQVEYEDDTEVLAETTTTAAPGS